MFLRKNLSRLQSIWSNSLARYIPWICIKRGVKSGKGDILIADIEKLDQMDASEIHASRHKAKEVLTLMKGEKIHLPSRRWNSKKISGGDRRPRNIHLNSGSSRTGNSSRRIRRTLLSIPTSRWTQHEMMRKLKKNSATITGEFIYRHHVEPRVKTVHAGRIISYSDEAHRTLPETTHTSLHVLLEKNIEDSGT